MSEYTEGWTRDCFGDLRKKIGSHTFHVIERDNILYLRLPGQTIATRPTIEECQILAHETERLWSGSDE